MKWLLNKYKESLTFLSLSQAFWGHLSILAVMFITNYRPLILGYTGMLIFTVISDIVLIITSRRSE